MQAGDTLTKNNFVQQEFKNQLIIPVLLTVIFIIFSFVPVVQILILTFSGGLMSLFQSNNNENIWTSNIIVNLLPSIILLFLFFKTTNQIAKIGTGTFAMIFMTAYIFFLTNGFSRESDPYFLDFIIVALLSGFILTIVAIMKYVLIKHKQT